eukprot:m.106162 g.106162  ORF g.106162 m.106162 type:complete len:689 (+) comp27703_c0_seq1:396-2462(+)
MMTGAHCIRAICVLTLIFAFGGVTFTRAEGEIQRSDVPWINIVEMPPALYTTAEDFDLKVFVDTAGISSYLELKARLKCDGVTLASTRGYPITQELSLFDITLTTNQFKNLIPVRGSFCSFLVFVSADGTWKSKVASFLSEDMQVVEEVELKEQEEETTQVPCVDTKGMCNTWKELGYCVAEHVTASCPLSCGSCVVVRDETMDTTTLTTTGTTTGTITEETTYPVPTRPPTSDRVIGGYCGDSISSCLTVASPSLCLDENFEALCQLSCGICTYASNSPTLPRPTIAPTLAPSFATTTVIPPTTAPTRHSPNTTVDPTSTSTSGPSTPTEPITTTAPIEPTGPITATAPTEPTESITTNTQTTIPTTSPTTSATLPASHHSTKVSTQGVTFSMTSPTISSSGTSESTVTGESTPIASTIAQLRPESTIAPKVCENSPMDWVDSTSTSCKQYSELKLCTTTGEPGVNWLNHRSEIQPKFRNSTYLAAIKACCLCGGGQWSFSTPNTSQSTLGYETSVSMIAGVAFIFVVVLIIVLITIRRRRSETGKTVEDERSKLAVHSISHPTTFPGYEGQNVSNNPLHRSNTDGEYSWEVEQVGGEWDPTEVPNDADSNPQMSIEPTKSPPPQKEPPTFSAPPGYLAIHGRNDTSTEYSQSHASESTMGDDEDDYPLAPVDFVSSRGSLMRNDAS